MQLKSIDGHVPKFQLLTPPLLDEEAVEAMEAMVEEHMRQIYSAREAALVRKYMVTSSRGMIYNRLKMEQPDVYQ